VGKALHYSRHLAVAIGTLTSAFWILAANSWMQTPAGFGTNEAGQFIPLSWLQIIFNPSFPYRLVHMVLAAYLSTALVVGSVAAFHMLRRARPRRCGACSRWPCGWRRWWRRCRYSPATCMASTRSSISRQRSMALEGAFRQHPDGAPLILFGLPDQAAGRVRAAIEIPETVVADPQARSACADGRTGRLSARDWPVVAVIFWTFRIMVGWGSRYWRSESRAWWRVRRGSLFSSRLLLHRAALLMGPAGIVAVIAGWFTTEVGRQPFTIYHVLRTLDSASPTGRSGGGRLAGRLRGGVLHGVRRRSVLHSAADARATARGRIP
jgi:cytochrome d ubiquinol oxidase subunit I